MEHHPSHRPSPASAAVPAFTDCAASAPSNRASSHQVRRTRRTAGLTLVEVMVSLILMATVMLGFIGTFIQSRRTTEASVLHAACTSVVYGIIEQIKQLEYSELLPSLVTDPTDAATTDAPNVRVRINQNTVKWLRVVYTPAPTDGSAVTPKGPLTTPSPGAGVTGVGADGSDAIDNWIGALPLSTVTGSMSQQINLNIWIWIDEIPDTYVSEVKKVTVVYTYSFEDGSATRTVRDREVFLRSQFDK